MTRAIDKTGEVWVFGVLYREWQRSEDHVRTRHRKANGQMTRWTAWIQTPKGAR